MLAFTCKRDGCGFVSTRESNSFSFSCPGNKTKSGVVLRHSLFCVSLFFFEKMIINSLECELNAVLTDAVPLHYDGVYLLYYIKLNIKAFQEII